MILGLINQLLYELNNQTHKNKSSCSNIEKIIRDDFKKKCNMNYGIFIARIWHN